MMQGRSGFYHCMVNHTVQQYQWQAGAFTHIFASTPHKSSHAVCVMQAASNEDRSGIGFCCYNPSCTGRKQMFNSGRALSLHLSLSPACEQFANQRDLKRNACQVASVDANVVVLSSKRPALLRRHHVNDSFPITHAAHVNCSVANEDCNDFISSDTPYDDDDAEVIAAFNNGFEDHALPEVDNGSVMLQLDTNQQIEPTINTIPLMYTNDQKWTVALLKLLDDMNAPDYAFEAIIKWAREANNDNYSFHPQGGLSRSKNVDVLFSSMHNAKKLLPNVQTVHVPHGPPCDVITYDFVPQLLSLLQNRKIMMQENYGH